MPRAETLQKSVEAPNLGKVLSWKDSHTGRASFRYSAAKLPFRMCTQHLFSDLIGIRPQLREWTLAESRGVCDRVRAFQSRSEGLRQLSHGPQAVAA